jgi:hypothetical protein
MSEGIVHIPEDSENLIKLFSGWYPFLYKAVRRYYSLPDIQVPAKAAAVFESVIHLPEIIKKKELNEQEFKKLIIRTIALDIKNHQPGYYISNTVDPNALHATQNTLFDGYKIVDFAESKPEDIFSALNLLSPPKRIVLNMHDWDGFTPEEISEILETSYQMIKMNLENARYDFQKYLEKILTISEQNGR